MTVRAAKLPVPLRRAGAALGAVALAAALTLAGVDSAQAAPAVRQAPIAPNCVHVLKIDRDWAGFPRAKIRNDCSSLQRVKIVWSSAPDSACKILSPRETASDTTGVFGEFAGLQRC